MRIIGGEHKSRSIDMPRGVKIRPTQDKVRESIFNILGDISAFIQNGIVPVIWVC